MQDQYDEVSIQKSKGLGNAYQQVANQERCAFLDASSIVTSSKLDGVHLDEQQCELLGNAVAKKIAEMMQFNIVNHIQESTFKHQERRFVCKTGYLNSKWLAD